MNATLDFPEQFWAKFPNYSHKKAKQKYEKYLTYIRNELIRETSIYGNKDTFYFSTYDAAQKCGVFYYNDKRYYVWYEFCELKPIINIIKKGNNMTEKKSLVTVDDQYIDLLISGNDGYEIANTWFDSANENSDVDYISIDEAGVEQYPSF